MYSEKELNNFDIYICPCLRSRLLKMGRGACRILFILLQRKSKCLSYDTFREKEELIFVEDFFLKKTINVKRFVCVPGTTYL